MKNFNQKTKPIKKPPEKTAYPKIKTKKHSKVYFEMPVQ